MLSGTPSPPKAGRSADKFALLPTRVAEGRRPAHRILGILCGTDHSTAMIWDLLDARFPGTAGWVVTNHGVKQWLDGAVSLLHLHGPAGCGKSVIAATIVDHLASTVVSPTTSLSYFFVDYRTPCSTATILSTMLAQLLAQSSEAYAEAEAFFGLPEEKTGVSSDVQFHQCPWEDNVRWVNYRDSGVLTRALQAATRHFRRNYVVLDGIDELERHEGLDSLFASLGALDWGRTRVLVIGRPVNPDRFEFPQKIPQGCTYCCCPISAHPDDIRHYAIKTTENLASRLSGGETLPEPLSSHALESTADLLASSRKCVQSLPTFPTRESSTRC
jgi:hypothetical protein